MSSLSNIIPSKGRRRPIQVDVDDTGVEVVAENDDRAVVVLYNVGPHTAWGSNTLEDATPEAGFPLKADGAIVEDHSFDAWFFRTDTGETADIRGWEV